MSFEGFQKGRYILNTLYKIEQSKTCHVVNIVSFNFKMAATDFNFCGIKQNNLKNS